MNHEIKKAIKKRIMGETQIAIRVIARFLRKVRLNRQLRLRRAKGLFSATLYLQARDEDRIKPRH